VTLVAPDLETSGGAFLGSGITNGMKTAVSIPDTVFEKAEAAAKRLKMSRSELYAKAVDAWVDAHSPDEITDSINAVLDQLTREEREADRKVVRAGARQTMKRNRW
jgi:metal-responsive CopG/Arc/MetJ family transcriptional regulator